MELGAFYKMKRAMEETRRRLDYSINKHGFNTEAKRARLMYKVQSFTLDTIDIINRTNAEICILQNNPNKKLEYEDFEPILKKMTYNDKPTPHPASGQPNPSDSDEDEICQCCQKLDKYIVQ